MYKIITVAGWARSLRTGNKDFCFVELYDGSHMNRL
jgi:aspartyl/asparaginyl-tRNA synthetase